MTSPALPAAGFEAEDLDRLVAAVVSFLSGAEAVINVLVSGATVLPCKVRCREEESVLVVVCNTTGRRAERVGKRQ